MLAHLYLVDEKDGYPLSPLLLNLARLKSIVVLTGHAVDANKAPVPHSGRVSSIEFTFFGGKKITVPASAITQHKLNLPALFESIRKTPPAEIASPFFTATDTANLENVEDPALSPLAEKMMVHADAFLGAYNNGKHNILVTDSADFEVGESAREIFESLMVFAGPGQDARKRGPGL